MNAEIENDKLQPESLPGLIDALNTQLLDESAESAARAFNLGCVLSGLVVGIVVTVTFLLSHWVTAFITLLITVLVAVSAASLLSVRARYNNMVRIYEESIVPKMQTIIQDGKLSYEQWHALVAETLPEDASLVLLLDKFPLEGTSHE